MKTLVSRKVDLEIVEAGCCGAFVALTALHLEDLRKTGDSFWCPNGHCRSYGEGSHGKEIARKQKEIDRLQNGNNYLNRANDDLLSLGAKQKKKIKSLEKRADVGTCSKCHRNFKQVARHMRRVHGVENDGLEKAE